MDATLHPAVTRPVIDDTQRARRKSEVDFARGSVRLEGGILFSAIERLSTRYVANKIDSDELTAAVLAHHAVRLGRMT